VSRLRHLEPVLLVIGMISQRDFSVDPVVARLTESFGPPSTITEPIPFANTDYYEEEMGPNLERRLLTAERLIDAGELADVKLRTNEIETEFASDGRRRVNLDPAYLCTFNFILATGKGFTHRPYLGNGIYADLTLMWQGGGWKSFPWTYADYRDARMQNHLTAFRDAYRARLKPAENQEEPTDD
jgi:Domain of unknown function (DUF4416)